MSWFHLGLQTCACELCAEGRDGGIRRVCPSCFRLESSLHCGESRSLFRSDNRLATAQSCATSLLPVELHEWVSS